MRGVFGRAADPAPSQGALEFPRRFKRVLFEEHRAILASRDEVLTMLKTIKVYGSLAKFLGQKVFRAAVSTPVEAMSFLRANFQGLAAHMADYDYKVLVGTLELQGG